MFDEFLERHAVYHADDEVEAVHAALGAAVLESAAVVADTICAEEAGFIIGEAAHEDVDLRWWRESV